VHLKVADLDRAPRLLLRSCSASSCSSYGLGAAFISAGGYHHHIGLNTWRAKVAIRRHRHHRLFHTAILYPTRAALADALHRVISAGIQLDGASDHGVSEALYLRDPDENGVELYWDIAEEQWPYTADGKLSMFTKRLDLDDLLRARGS
jgi:catechol 2,3-dioxygenase